MKRTFSRQIIWTVLLILLSLIVLSVSFQALFYRYTVSIVTNDLRNTADAVADIAQLYNFDSQTSDLMLRMQLSFAARATGNDTVLCDSSGRVVACACGMQSCSHLGTMLDIQAMTPRDGDDCTVSKTLVNNLYGQQELSVAMPVTTQIQYGSGVTVSTVTGYVVASTSYDNLNSIMLNTLRINLTTLLIVLPLAFLVVFLVVRRQNKPMKELTDAARRLGRGQLSTRVPTGGDNTTEQDELAVAFNNMAQAMEKAETQRQEFVANVSHELKTPMTTISGYVGGMLDGTIPPEQERKYMTIISEEIKRLSKLVRSMLEVSRLKDKGIDSEQKHDFDICETIGQVLIRFEQKINDKHIDVQPLLPEEPAMVFADPDSIMQVVYNLIDNAVKFCPDGGTLGVRVVQTTNNKYLISVSNTGKTIRPEELPLVFDRFHKADKSRSSDREGVGLGLYIVKTIICSHEEDIFVSSKDNKTEFSFTLRKAQ